MEKDIDILSYYFCFIRNRVKIFLLIILFSVSGVFYSLIQQRVWSGSFEIVMQQSNDNKKSLVSSSSADLIDIINFDGSSSDSTELEILRSPLVLTPVYDFYNNLLKSQNLKKVSYERGFISKLNISPKKGSQVLKVSFEDTDKEIIVKTLNKLSDEYQDYSKSGRKKTLNNSINFINSQLKLARLNSEKSMKDLQTFNVKHSLGTFDGFVLGGENIPSMGERPRRFNDKFKYLASLESEIVRMKGIYKPDAQILKNLIRSKEEYEKSLKRPSEILNQYRNKISKATFDEEIYRSLVKQLYLLEFEKARNVEAWQLISNPKILDIPVRPNRKKIVFLSASSGLLISFLFFMFLDKKSDLLFTRNDFNKVLPYPLLKTISKDNSTWLDNLTIILESIKAKNKKFNLLPLIPEDSELFNTFASFFKSNFKNGVLLKKNDINSLKEFESIILFTSAGLITKTNLNLFLEEVKLLDIDIKGFVYLDPYLKDTSL